MALRFLLVVVLLCCWVGRAGAQFSLPVLQVFESPCTFPQSISVGHGVIHLGCADSNRIYVLDLDTAEVIASVDTGFNPIAMDAFEDTLWVVFGAPLRLAPLDAVNLESLEPPVVLPDADLTDVAFDGEGGLWMCTREVEGVFVSRLNRWTGEIIIAELMEDLPEFWSGITWLDRILVVHNLNFSYRFDENLHLLESLGGGESAVNYQGRIGNDGVNLYGTGWEWVDGEPAGRVVQFSPRPVGTEKTSWGVLKTRF